MLIDELTMALRAGDGGDGVLRWRHLRGKDLAGPAGGDGGRGGDVYAKAVRDIGILSRYRNQKEFVAEQGAPGGNESLHGKSGEDLIMEFPMGSILTNLTTHRVISLLKEGQTELLLKGGAGGWGNEHFKSSTDRSPRKITKGRKGEGAEFSVDLELIADVGLIGLPNAGKSSLLNALTKADAKVGAYPFTTLEPNLGSFHGYILADIPGLIEGASEGKGLGHKFLRHVKRTRVLFHLVSLENEDILGTYRTIRSELGRYAKELLVKPEIVILTKTDLIDEKEIAKKIKEMKKENPRVYAVTLYDDESVAAFVKEFSKILTNEVK